MDRVEFFDLDGGAVKARETYRQMPTVRLLYKYDRSKNHKFYYDVITFMYYMYNIKGDKPTYLSNLSESRRLDLLLKRQLKEYKKEDFTGNKYVRDIVMEFNDIFLLESEQAMETIKEDFVKFRKRLLSVPYTMKKNITFEKEIDGKTEKLHFTIDYPNDDAKNRALAAYNNLKNTEKQLLAEIEEEKIKSKSSKKTRLFENAENIPNHFDNDYPYGKD